MRIELVASSAVFPCSGKKVRKTPLIVLHFSQLLGISYHKTHVIGMRHSRSRTVVGKSSIGRLYVCAGGLDIPNLTKIPLIYNVSYFNLVRLGALFEGLSPGNQLHSFKKVTLFFESKSSRWPRKEIFCFLRTAVLNWGCSHPQEVREGTSWGANVSSKDSYIGFVCFNSSKFFV